MLEEDFVSNKFPYLIASTYWNMANELEPLKKINCLCSAFDTLLRHLAIIMLSDYRQRPKKFLPPQVSRRIVECLHRPSLGQWNQILREMCTEYKERDEQPFAPEIRPFFAVSQKNLDKMIDYRNEWKRRIEPSSPSEVECKDKFREYNSTFDEILAELEFLSRYQLFVARQMTCDAEKFTITIGRYIGKHTQPQQIQIESRRYFICERPLLIRMNQDEEDEALNLYPLLIWDVPQGVKTHNQIFMYQSTYGSDEHPGHEFVNYGGTDVPPLKTKEYAQDFKRLYQDLMKVDEVMPDSKSPQPEKAPEPSDLDPIEQKPPSRQPEPEQLTLPQKKDDVREVSLNDDVDKVKEDLLDLSKSGDYEEIYRILGFDSESVTSRSARHEIEYHVEAGYPLLYIVSWEEERVLEALGRIAKDKGMTLCEWSITSGLKQVGQGSVELPGSEPSDVINWVLTYKEPVLLVLKDFHYFIDDSLTIRQLRDAVNFFRKQKEEVLGQDDAEFHKAIVFLSPTLAFPDSLEKDLQIFAYPWPEEEELGALLNRIIERNKLKDSLPLEQRDQLAYAALGLTLQEAEVAYNKAILKGNGTLRADAVRVIIEEKAQLIRKLGLLEFFNPKETFADVGGLDVLKEWLRVRRDYMSDKASYFGLSLLKGLLLIGIPGCGKSLCAKAIAAEWNRPLLRMDIGWLFSGLMGASEENMRQALNIAEVLAPCILWIDEVEKGFAGYANTQGSGVTARIFGTLLTWFQENELPVFVVATANQIGLLPPEFTRKGRFDEIFFIDLPSLHERERIFEIHLKKHQREANQIQLDALPVKVFAEKTEGFTGAEIEQVIVSALYDAFDANRKLMPEDIYGNISLTIPLSVTMKEKVKALRNWADRVRPASTTTLKGD